MARVNLCAGKCRITVGPGDKRCDMHCVKDDGHPGGHRCTAHLYR